MRKRAMAAVVAGSVVMATLAAITPGTALAADRTTTREVVAALDSLDTRSNLVVDAAESSTVSVPSDPTQGVTFTANGQTMTVGLPNAQQGGKGVTRKGVTVYSGRNCNANAVVEAAGAAQFLNAIKCKGAPTKYDFPATVPTGGKIMVAPDGAGAVVFDGRDRLFSVVPAPFAEDANGNSVRTRFTTDGKTLTQHVAHTTRGVVYPVVFDPLWLFIPAWILRACGLGFLTGWGGAWINGDDFWHRWGQGIWNCLMTALGLHWLKK